MKRFLAFMLSMVVAISTMVVPVFAAEATGTAGDPITTIPRSKVDSSNGTITGYEQTVNVSSTDLKVTITDLETTQVDGKWVLSNPLSAPTKNTIKTEISSASQSKVEINGDTVLAGSSSEKKDYAFTAGKTYTIIVIDKDDSGKKFYWEFTVPSSEKNAPSMTVNSNGSDLSPSDGKFSDTSVNYDRKAVKVVVSDVTGIDHMIIAEFPDGNFSGTPLKVSGRAVKTSALASAKENYSGLEFTYTELEGVNNNGMVFDKATGNLTSVRDSYNFQEDSYIRYIVSDVFGNEATYDIVITGINPQNDATAPSVKLNNVQKSEKDGKVVEVSGTIVVSDAPGTVSTVTITHGSKELYREVNIDQQVKEYPVTIKAEDTDKVIKVIATDRAGLVTEETFNFSSYFGEGDNQGGNNGGQGGNDNQAPKISLGEVTKEVADGVVNKIQAIIQLGDTVGLKHVKVTASGVVVVDEDITGATAKSYIVSMGSSVNNKNIEVVVTNTNGKSTTQIFDMSSYFKTDSSGSGDGSTGSDSIKSASDLKKAISNPVYTYDDGFTTVEFEIDKTKVGNAKVEWTLDDLDGDELDTSTGNSYSFEFDEDSEDPGRYKIMVQVGDIKTTVGFDVEYRDDTIIASALSVDLNYIDNDECEIELSLDGTILDNARKARWTFPNGNTDTGKKVTYTVNENGKYTFRIRTDDETYTHTVVVDELGFGDSNSNTSSNNGNSSSNDNNNQDVSASDSGNKYTGSNNPKPGSGLVSNITSATQKVTIPMSNWDKDEWTLDKNSIPAGISVEESGNDLVFTTPNQNTRVTFRMVNSKGEYVEYNFDVAQRNTDGSNMAGNAQTGGQLPVNTGMATNEPMAAIPCAIDGKFNKGSKESLNDDDID